LIEVRGLGLFRMPFVDTARLRLVVRLGDPVPRLPEAVCLGDFGVPELAVEPFQTSAAMRIEIALDAVLGKAAHVVGAFAA
jgi:HPr kinase/phosphorylase